MAEWSWTEWRDRCHALAREKGWHDEEHSNAHLLMLVVTEVAEAVEAFRERGLEAWVECPRCGYEWDARFGCLADHCIDNRPPPLSTMPKPCGAASELADVAIRVLDIAGLRGVPVGGVLRPQSMPADLRDEPGEFVSGCMAVVRELAQYASLRIIVTRALESVVLLSKRHGIDLAVAIEQKASHHATRPYRHGGKLA